MAGREALGFIQCLVPVKGAIEVLPSVKTHCEFLEITQLKGKHMLQSIEAILESYCLGVLGLFMAFIERTHGALAIGLPLLVTLAVHHLLPAWAAAVLAALVWVPAAIGMGIILLTGLNAANRR